MSLLSDFECLGKDLIVNTNEVGFDIKIALKRSYEHLEL